jgi:hypothetical protein
MNRPLWDPGLGQFVSLRDFVIRAYVSQGGEP